MRRRNKSQTPRACIAALFFCMERIWLSDLPEQLHPNENHTFRRLSGHNKPAKWDCAGQCWGWEKGRRENLSELENLWVQLGSQMREVKVARSLTVHQKVCSSRGPQGRPWLWINFVRSKLTLIKKTLHPSDWAIFSRSIQSHGRQPALLLDSCCCWQTSDQRAVILLSLHQSYKINSQFMAMVKYFCHFYVSY